MMRCLPVGIFLFAVTCSFGIAADGDLPDGPGKDVLVKMCVNCHGADRVTGAKYSKKMWSAVVDDMVSRGAEGTDDEIDILVAYLARNFGKPVNINTATAKEMEDDLSLSTADAEALVSYRTGHGEFKTYEDVVKVPGLDTKAIEEQKKNIVFSTGQ